MENLYFRENPDSQEAYYGVEEGLDVQARCPHDDNNLHHEFIWQRSKSNENLKHGFTHYLTRYAYADEYHKNENIKKFDEYRGIDIRKRNYKPISIKIDDGNDGIICALWLERFGYTDEERDIPEEVLLIIRQEETQDGRIRLISGYSTDKSEYIDLYVDDIIPKLKSARLKTRPFLECVLEENRDFYREHYRKGYRIFQKIIADRKGLC